MQMSHSKAVLNGVEVLPPLGMANESPAGAARTTKRRTAGDRFVVINTFADFTLRELSRAEISVWLLLWRDTKPNGLARTSQANLAARAGVTVRTIERTIRTLQDRGLLVVVRRGQLQAGPSTYRVLPLSRTGLSDNQVGKKPDILRRIYPTPVSDIP
jgi:biotin operon repressor